MCCHLQVGGDYLECNVVYAQGCLGLQELPSRLIKVLHMRHTPSERKHWYILTLTNLLSKSSDFEAR